MKINSRKMKQDQLMERENIEWTDQEQKNKRADETNQKAITGSARRTY